VSQRERERERERERHTQRQTLSLQVKFSHNFVLIIQEDLFLTCQGVDLVYVRRVDSSVLAMINMNNLETEKDLDPRFNRDT
jgi:urease accessory protein UreE